MLFPLVIFPVTNLQQCFSQRAVVYLDHHESQIRVELDPTGNSACDFPTSVVFVFNFADTALDFACVVHNYVYASTVTVNVSVSNINLYDQIQFVDLQINSAQVQAEVRVSGLVNSRAAGDSCKSTYVRFRDSDVCFVGLQCERLAGMFISRIDMVIRGPDWQETLTSGVFTLGNDLEACWTGNFYNYSLNHVEAATLSVQGQFYLLVQEFELLATNFAIDSLQIYGDTKIWIYSKQAYILLVKNNDFAAFDAQFDDSLQIRAKIEIWHGDYRYDRIETRFHRLIYNSSGNLICSITDNETECQDVFGYYAMQDVETMRVQFTLYFLYNNTVFAKQFPIAEIIGLCFERSAITISPNMIDVRMVTRYNRKQCGALGKKDTFFIFAYFETEVQKILSYYAMIVPFYAKVEKWDADDAHVQLAINRSVFDEMHAHLSTSISNMLYFYRKDGIYSEDFNYADDVEITDFYFDVRSSITQMHIISAAVCVAAMALAVTITEIATRCKPRRRKPVALRKMKELEPVTAL